MIKRIVVVAGIIAASVAGFPSSAPARGLDDIWDIVDALSGPGPFVGGPVLAATIPCWQGRSVSILTAPSNPGRLDPCIYVDFRDMYVDPKGPFQRVSAKFVEAGATFQQHAALDVGFGIGVAYFATTVGRVEYNVKNFTATPLRVVVKPLRLFIDSPRAGALQVHFRATVRFGDIDGSDFGAPASTFRAGTEVLRGVGLVIDLWQLAKR
jgi:hypothetical protein